MSRLPVEPEWLEGPRLVEWLEAHGLVSPDLQLGSLARRIPDWRHGSAASVFTVDRVLIKLGCHLSELPDDLWTSPPQGTRERRAA